MAGVQTETDVCLPALHPPGGAAAGARLPADDLRDCQDVQHAPDGDQVAPGEAAGAGGRPRFDPAQRAVPVAAGGADVQLASPDRAHRCPRSPAPSRTCWRRAPRSWVCSIRASLFDVPTTRSDRDLMCAGSEVTLALLWELLQVPLDPRRAHVERPGNLVDRRQVAVLQLLLHQVDEEPVDERHSPARSELQPVRPPPPPV